MAYRRRHSAKSYPTFAVDPPSSPTGEDGSSLAAAAIRASALRRGLSLSSASGGSVLSSSCRDSSGHGAPGMQQASKAYECTSFRDFSDSKSSGFWGVLAVKTKNIFDEENGAQKIEALVRGGPQTSEASTGIQFHQSHQSTEIPPKMENPTIQKGLNAVTTSLNYIGGTIGNALEEGFTVMEAKAADIISDTRKLHIRRKENASDALTQHSTDPDVKGLRVPAINMTSTQGDFETQLKASRDVAMTMAAKAKLLLRELKAAKADLAFAKERCLQLEDENRLLREATEKGDSAEVDDLGERKVSVIVGITLVLLLHVSGFYWWYRNDDLLYPLVMLPPKSIPPFWHGIFIIVVNDTMVRQAAMLFKCMILIYYKNSRGRDYRRQGQMLTLVEYLLLLYRALLPTPVWYRFFLNKEYGSLFSSLTTGLYLTFKLTSIVEKVQSFFVALKALSRKDVHYGSYATPEQVNAAGDLCAICQEKMHAPILLRCKHIFCEDCVSEWFERERTCPLCRALVKPADLRSFGDGSTSLFFQLF